MKGQVLVTAFLAAGVAAAQAPPQPSATVKREAVLGALLTDEQKLAFGKRALLDEEPFLSSYQARYPQTMGLLFGSREYGLLHGNPLVGYVADEGFAWPKGGRDIAFLGMRNAPRASALTAEAWATAFTAAAKGRGLVVNPRSARTFEGACVSLTEDPEQGLVGLVVEARFTGPGGQFLVRAQFAAPRLGQAMTGALDWVLGYALTQGDSAGAEALAKRLKAKATPPAPKAGKES